MPNTFNVGDRVKVINEHSMFNGDEGKIIEIDNNLYNIEFGEDNTIWKAENELELVTPTSNTIRVGDMVKIIKIINLGRGHFRVGDVVKVLELRSMGDILRVKSNRTNDTDISSDCEYTKYFKKVEVRQPNDFRVGDEVEIINYQGNVRKGYRGIIRYKTNAEGYFAVEITKPANFSRGHDCDGNTPRDKGYNVLKTNLRLINGTYTQTRDYSSEIDNLRESLEAQLITKPQKEKQVVKIMEEQMLDRLNNPNTIFEKIRIVDTTKFKIGTWVTNVGTHHSSKIEGMITTKKTNTCNVLKIIVDGIDSREPSLKEYKYEDLKIIPPPTVAKTRRGRLFKPRTLEVLNTKTTKQLIKQIKGLREVKKCVMDTYESRPCLHITTKDLKLRYGNKNYKIGEYEIVVKIEDKLNKFELDEYEKPKLHKHVFVKRVKGAVYVPQYGWKQFLFESDGREKDFANSICFGAHKSLAKKLLKQHKYSDLVEIIIGLILSKSTEGYSFWWYWLPCMKIGMTADNHYEKIKEITVLKPEGFGNCSGCGCNVDECHCEMYHYEDSGAKFENDFYKDGKRHE